MTEKSLYECEVVYFNEVYKCEDTMICMVETTSYGKAYKKVKKFIGKSFFITIKSIKVSDKVLIN